MPITRIMPRPGFIKDDPAYTTEGYWQDGDKVRFRLGKPEKIGGYTKISNSTILGVCRGLFSWTNFSENIFHAAGTDIKFYVYDGGVPFDITPIATTFDMQTDTFTSTDGTIAVTVTVTSHNTTAGSYVTFGSVTDFNNLTIDGIEFAITSVVDSNTFIVESSTTANASGSGGGGNASAEFQIPIGKPDTFVSYGWGAGDWGEEEWGDPRTTTETGITDRARTWSIGQWGEDIIANHVDGAIYTWDSSGGTGNRMTLISASAPSEVNAIFVTDDRHLVALGADVAGSINAMNIAWSDQEDFALWTPAADNTAGSQVLAGGSRLVAGVPLRGVNLIWSDTHTFAMQFLGPPFTFGFQRLGRAGLSSPNAFAEHRGHVYWWGNDEFYVWRGGAPEQIPNPLEDFVYDRLNREAKDKIYAGILPKFHEVWWFYPSGSELDSYVVYNTEENIWYTGTFDRTSMATRANSDRAIMTDADGMLYEHEIPGVVDANGSILPFTITSSPIDIGDGDVIMNVRHLIPDMIVDGTVYITVQTRRYPQANLITRVSAKEWTSASRKLDTRISGRQVQYTIFGSSTGVDMRLGDMRADVYPGGRR